VGGRPLLAYWLDLCAREGITDVLLNVSHHFAAVHAFLDADARRDVRVQVVHETAPSGTATTVRRERAFVNGQDDFWVLYADNLSDVHTASMLARHRTHRDPMTLGLFHTPDPKASGIVALDGDNLVISFVEKPEHPEGDLANAGVYLARTALLDTIGEGPEPVDFGQHVLPRLVGRMHGHVIEDFHQDIGTPDRLARAAAAWAARTRQ
jgi:mannose-1-phosphate guanylyltransferase